MAVDVGTTYVIVAIPASDDPSWKASSEKIPHVTLLYLGDQLANVDRVQKFIKHAVDTTMHPFVLDGDHRGELGKNPVEVLFFKPYGIDKLDDFRTQLLSNNDIHLSYNSTTQFPEWVPHLTLGSADVPAKEDEATYPGTTSVYFDRIALWRGNYEGVEFPMKPSTDPLVMAMERGKNFLSHHGVKGQKWGVRHDTPTGGSSSGSTKETKANAKASSNDEKLKKITETNRRAQVADKLKRKQLVDIKPSKDAREAGFVKTKAKVSGVNTLSNQDLQQLITRMSLERQFKDLKKIEHEETLVGAGKKWAGNFINDVAKDTAASWLKRPGGASADRGPIKVKAWTTGNQFADALDGPHKAIGK